ncbi:hypothetical protein ACFPYI_09385 [Halomarina salina]|uniref:MFS transporter n=1 Tax=Halomarina salina TaxID=1872699 RepID=A0ABD5RLM1_9EURY|nr:hypothetical protein [Halomarina salina]
MFAPLRRTLRDRLGLRSVASALLFTVFLAWLFDQSFGSAVESAAAAALVGGSGLVADAYGLRDEVRGLGFGVYVFVAGVALALLDPTPYVGEAFAVVGAWLLLDNVQTLRHDGVAEPEREPADGEEVYRQYLAQRIRDRLDERPHTRRELREAFEETPDAVDEALALLEERGLVDREGSEFRTRERQSRGPVGRALARLARPLTLELRDDGDRSAVGDVPPTGSRVADRTTPDRSAQRDRPDRSGRPGDASNSRRDADVERSSSGR